MLDTQNVSGARLGLKKRVIPASRRWSCSPSAQPTKRTRLCGGDGGRRSSEECAVVGDGGEGQVVEIFGVGVGGGGGVNQVKRRGIEKKIVY